MMQQEREIERNSFASLPGTIKTNDRCSKCPCTTFKNQESRIKKLMLNWRVSAMHEFGGPTVGAVVGAQRSAAHTWSPPFSSVAGDFRRFLCTSSSSSLGLSPLSSATSLSSSSTFSFWLEDAVGRHGPWVPTTG